MPAKKRTVRERLLSNLRILPNGCWEWLGFIMPNGYGQFGIGTKHFLVHRVSYEEFVGPIPEGLTLDHKCHTPEECPGGKTCPHRRCINPEHLGPENNRDNILRGCGPSAQQARQTECKNGHPLEGENLKITPSGKRRCRECLRAYKRASNQAKWGANPEAAREKERQRVRRPVLSQE